LQACKQSGVNNDNSLILVKVNNNSLRLNEIDTATLSRLSGEDSVEFVLQQEDAWINEQVLLKRAEESLSEQEMSLDKELKEYKNNLLLYAFRERLVLDQLDTAVTQEEIGEYYNNNKSNFELKRNIAKILFVKVTKENFTPDIQVWMEEGSASSLASLKSFCELKAENYFISDSLWLYFDDVWKEIPISKTYNRERFMNSNKFLIFEESPYTYLLKMNDFRIKNSLSPLEFEKGKIREIILNKRKIILIKKREREIIEAAYSNGEVNILRNKK
jgi:hypothetical protein